MLSQTTSYMYIIILCFVLAARFCEIMCCCGGCCKLRYTYKNADLTWKKKTLIVKGCGFDTLRLRQHGHHFPDNIFKCIFLNENIWILIEIWLGFVHKCPINNIPTSVQIMAWRQPGDKPSSEPVMIRLLVHICITQPQWINKEQHNVVVIIVHDMSLNMQLR